MKRFYVHGSLKAKANSFDELETWLSENSPVRNWEIMEAEDWEDWNDEDIAVKEVICDECGNEFDRKYLRPYKYEPKRLVCEDCHDQLMEE